jgi:RHS repeat-associated protein
VSASGTLYYHHDQLGSTRALTSSTGTVVATYSYDPYGNLTGSTGTATNPLRYAGQYADAESGLYYLRARYYDPATAQFLGRDPIERVTQQPYQYAHGSPFNEIDPGGLGCGWTSPWDCAGDVVDVGLKVTGTVIHYSPAGQLADLISRTTGVTVGGCVGGSAFAGVGVTGSICYYSTPSGQAGITVTAGGGVGGPAGANLMIGPSVSNAQQLCQLGSWFYYGGGTLGEGLPDVGGQVAVGDSNGHPIWVGTGGWTPGVSVPTPFSVEGGKTYTWTFQAW